MRWMAPLALLAILAWPPVAPAGADELDDLAARPPAEAVPALEARLAEAEGDPALARRLRGLLADAHLRAGDPDAAVPYLEAIVAARPDDAQARIRYGEALLAVARGEIARAAMGRNIMPFLQDALDAVAPLPPRRDPRYDESWRARLTRVVVEARYLTRAYDDALVWIADADIDSLPEDARAGLHDLEARVLYARGDLPQAAEAFERAGNALGAASAYDAARRPDQSLPIYARLVAAAPADAALLERVLASAQFHKNHGALYAALGSVPTPEGIAGVPLLRARAQMLEATGRAAEGVPLLEDAAKRDPENAAVLLDLGRLTVLAATDIENEDVWDAAADAFIAALKRDPESSAAVDALSWLAARDYGRLWKSWRDTRVSGRCVRVQEAIVEHVPDDALGWANLGNTLRVLGRHDEALAAYDHAREANPYDPAIRSDQGLALSAAGRFAESLEAYEDSTRLDTGHLSGRQNAARVLWRQGRDDEAEAHLAAAVRTSRAVGGRPGTYRFLLDRIWRTRRNPAVR